MPTPTLLARTGNSDVTDARTQPSLTPDPAKPVTLFVAAPRNGDPGAPAITGTNGWNGSWTQKEHLYGNFCCGSLFTFTPVSDVDGTITMTYPASTNGSIWEVVEWADGNTTDLSNSNSDSATDVGTASAVGLAALASDSETYVGVYILDADDAIANEGGSWVDLGTEVYISGPGNGGQLGAWLNGQDTTPTMSWATSVGWVSCGCEIKIAGGLSIPIAMRHYLNMENN